LIEVLAFSDSLDESEVFLVEQYLRFKYNPPVDLPRRIVIDYGFCDTSLVAYQPWFRTYEWSTGSTDSTIVINQSGWYSVEVTDIFGYTSTDSVEVIFDGDFIVEDQILCEFETLDYNTELSLADYEVLWSTSETSPSIAITEEGFYSVTVTDTLGCSYTTPEIFVDVDSFPSAASLFLPDVFCLGNELFLSSGFEEAEEYFWSTNEFTPFIMPVESGEYWVEATNANGCVGRDTVQVDIVGVAPDVQYSTGPPCEDNPVLFSDETVPEDAVISEWLWTIQSENESESETFETQEAVFVAGELGAIFSSLTVTLDNGCTGIARDTVFVNPLPLVNFSAPIICAGNEVFFESLSGVPGDGDIAAQDWVFGNGTTDSGQIGSTTFENLGPNTVTHIVTTEEQCVDSLVRTIEVLGSPIADFEVNDVCVNTTAIFNEDVDVSVSGPVFYNWQFGDGFFSNFPNTAHDYAQPGVYEVTLTATGNNVGTSGCVDQVTKQIRVYEAPDAEVLTADACLGEFTQLVDLTAAQTLEGLADPITQRQWTIADSPTGTQQGELGTDSVQFFLPLAAGTFAVELSLTTAAGCEASADGSFLVQSIPTANFTLELPIESPPFGVTPQNLTTDSEEYEWLVNGELVSTEFEPVLNFEQAGEYAVWLVATNELNCNDTVKLNYTVVVPQYDLELLSLRYENVGNSLALIAIVANNSNVRVDFFDTDVEVGRDIEVRINSELSIPAGQLKEYVLGAEIGYLPGRDLPYTCMHISNPNGQTDIDTTNNSLCIGLNDRRATFAEPFPNPSKDAVRLTVILPEDGDLRLEVSASDGRQLVDVTYAFEEGLNEIDYSLTGWAEGLYLFKFSYRGQEEVKRVVIAR
jgi:PKD repeat protein